MRTARIAISTKPMLSAGSNAPAAAATAATTIMQISAARPASFSHARASAPKKPGRQNSAATRSIGYSSTREKSCGARSAQAMPPRTPPSDMQT